jgi:hypothetical protein
MLSVSQSTKINLISDYIDCDLMDVSNISNLIDQFTVLTPLQQYWKRFCIEKSLPDISDFNDFKIIESIKGTSSHEDNVFLHSRSIFEFIEYCDESTLKVLINEVLNNINFKFFNASLIYSCADDDFDFAYEYMDEQLIHAEQEFDGYQLEEENEEDFLLASAQSSKIKFIRYCLERIHEREVKFPELKKVFDQLYSEGKIDIPTKIYNRIWNRVIEYDFDPYE